MDGGLRAEPRSGKTSSGRGGTEALALLSAPLNVQVLRELSGEPRELLDLRRAVGLPPQSTLRIYLKKLTELGAIRGDRLKRFPTATRYALTPAGVALVGVATVLEAWLWGAANGPIELGTVPARSAIKALVEGWSNNIVLALAVRPLSLTDLNRLVPRLPYPSLERRLSAMRLAGLVEAQGSNRRVKPYRVTEWLRRASAPITAAIAWERTHAPAATGRIGRLDVEGIFLLSVPLIVLPEGVSGKCRLAVEVQDGDGPRLAGVTVGFEGGVVTSCAPSVEGEADAWVVGNPLAWIRQRPEGSLPDLEMGGDTNLAAAVVEGLGRTSSGRSGLQSQPDVAHLSIHAKT